MSSSQVLRLDLNLSLKDSSFLLFRIISIRDYKITFLGNIDKMTVVFMLADNR